MKLKARVKLLTFSTQTFRRPQRLLVQSGSRAGISEYATWTQDVLKKTEFYRKYREILDGGRGAGFWLWKPYLIRAELESLKPGDFLVYYDVGRPEMPNRFGGTLGPVLDWSVEHGGMFPGVYIPEHGRNAKWTKRECFVLMNCDSDRYWDHPQVQATFSVWRKSAEAVQTIDEWLSACLIPGVISDEGVLDGVEDFPDFVDHRHDQSVLTNVVIRRGLDCFGDVHKPIVNPRDINASKDVNVLLGVMRNNRTTVRLILIRRFVNIAFRRIFFRLKEALHVAT